MSNGREMKGTLVLMTKNVLNFNHNVTKADDISTSKIDMHLLGAAGKEGKKTLLEKHPASSSNLGHGQDSLSVTFKLDKNFKTPEAFFIKNSMEYEFFLVSLTLEGNSNDGTIHFVCNSWIYRAQKERIFFVNKSYLPDKTPAFLIKHRKKELESLRGDGKGTRKEHDRVYDYDVYNDLGNPDSKADLARPVLGGSSAYPYPRRGRTGRKATKRDKNSETPSSDTYIPRDENFGHLKSPDFLTYGIKLLSENVITQFKSSSGLRNEFDKFDDIHKLFENGLLHHLPEDVVRNIKEISPTIGERFLKFPTPDVIRVSKSEWMTDDEFGREMLAGVNPCVIQRLQELPPKSKLDASKYGDQTSTITREHLKNNLGKLTVEEALSANRLFILDHHDAFLPYLKKINELPNRECYATRTILFLKDDGTLKPLAIELSQPNPEGDKFGAHSTVILPAQQGVKGTIWLMAKAYVLVNDSNYHQLVTHWLNTHAIIEPFVIATNRNLSVLHPIHKLLSPHYRGTMNVNGIARQSLFNAGGIIEQSFLPGRYALEMSSAAYKNWVFTDQALPNDLVKRGMAIKDQSRPHGVRLVIKDYPYAVDGLEIWSAIETWVKYYVDVYYTDSDVNNDTELRDWWKEVVEKGHGDLKDKPWWPKLKTREDLYQICSIIIWTASGLHAAVNFGQYPYGGYILNRPTLSTRLIPVEGKAEYDEMVENPEKAYLSTFTPEYETLVHLSVIEILSRHASDEVYLGQRDNPNWIDDKSTKALQAFQKFGNKLKEIEDNIKRRNRDSSLRNRNGPVQMPYTVLLPNNEEGLTFRGIPNSISI
ncbi:hypothetical protein LR48_Vigan346s002400 [Vigna angularis]|uniref:Lipoxygenase n=2 Tax=Phaseolus angularis TaxID=3914 RepID=A0A0L9T8Q8_PHAAN|nr:linoleate 9S-lipoxygenase 1 [Vigna angularis]KOM26942.1 hypothetical protein LR48_Vigan346s002400 [Vigna angularis]BAT98351.1 hypothetical protein VIGAN_09199800 [Vigna angularis var. angularis]